jgi:hypothetical protein
MPRELTAIEKRIASDLARTAAERVTQVLADLIMLTDYGEQDLMILAAAAGVVVGLTAGTLEQIGKGQGSPWTTEEALAGARALLGLHILPTIPLEAAR